MPYPYLPPEIPAIVKSVNTESASIDSASIDDDINSFKPSLKNTVKSHSKPSQSSSLLSVLKSTVSTGDSAGASQNNSQDNSQDNSQQLVKSPKSLVNLSFADENNDFKDINSHNEHSPKEEREEQKDLLSHFKKQNIKTIESLSDTDYSGEKIEEYDQSLSEWQPNKISQKDRLNHHKLLNKLRQNDSTGTIQDDQKSPNLVEMQGGIKDSNNSKDLAKLYDSTLPNNDSLIDKQSDHLLGNKLDRKSDYKSDYKNHSVSKDLLTSSQAQFKLHKNSKDKVDQNTIDFENDQLTNYSNYASNNYASNNYVSNYADHSLSNSFSRNGQEKQVVNRVNIPDQLTGDRSSSKNFITTNNTFPQSSNLRNPERFSQVTADLSSFLKKPKENLSTIGINKISVHQKLTSLTSSIRKLKNTYYGHRDQLNTSNTSNTSNTKSPSAIFVDSNTTQLSKIKNFSPFKTYSKPKNFIPVHSATQKITNQSTYRQNLISNPTSNSTFNFISATTLPPGLNTKTVLYKLPAITSPFDAQQVNSDLLGDTLEIGLPRPLTLAQNISQPERNEPKNYRLNVPASAPLDDLNLPSLEPDTNQQEGENINNTENSINNTEGEKVIDVLEKYRRRRPPGGKANEKLPAKTTPIINVPVPEDVIEVTADQQEFDEQQQTVSAQGNVVVRFREGLLTADLVQVNLITRQLQAQGEAAIARGEQILQGDRIEFNLTLQTGVIDRARGIIYAPTASTDLAPLSPTLPTVGGIATSKIPLSERLQLNQPAVKVKEEPGVSTTIGAGNRGGLRLPQTQGQVDRLRFEAERIDLTGNGGWTATNLRLTNDPFSPPEIELRANQAIFTKLNPLQDELITTNSRLVFDQKYSVPLFKKRTVIDRTEREPFPVQFGYDQKDRGGLFVQGSFKPLPKGIFDLKLTPQFYIQKAINGSEGGTADLFGLKANLLGNISPQTKLLARADFLTFDGFPDIPDDKFRASARLQHIFGQRADGTGYTLTGEYSYRDRLFNGTLGYQTVHSTVGLVLTSPDIRLGRKGTKLRFQTAFQNINARTDRRDLLDLEIFEPIPADDEDPRGRAELNRFQTAISVNYPIKLWAGKALPATKEEGLRYTPTPTIPFIQLLLGASAATSIYSNNDSQSYIRGSIGLIGQFGHFSRKYFDYTGFNIIYSATALNGESPFYFDRVVDTSVLTVGFVQQIYGGLRIGMQNSFSLTDGGNVDNEFTIEYSRRSYGITLRYSPRREIGTILLRISDFNWSGGTNTFDDVQNVDNSIVSQ